MNSFEEQQNDSLEISISECDWPQVSELVASLSERELTIFLLLGKGLSNQQIAKDLHIAERTVKSHMTSMMAKLGVESRLQAGIMSAIYQMLPFVTDQGTIAQRRSDK